MRRMRDDLISPGFSISWRVIDDMTTLNVSNLRCVSSICAFCILPRAAALRGAVGRRDDDARDLHGLVERARLRPRLLADLRVDDEELLVGLRDLEDLLHLLDEALLELVAARRVDDDDVALGAKLLQ